MRSATDRTSGGLLGLWRWPALFVASGLGIVLFAAGGPGLWSYFLAVTLFMIAWVILLPRGWFRDSDRSTQKIVTVFLVLRLVMPAIFSLVTENSEVLFGNGTDADFYDFSARMISDQIDSGDPILPTPVVPGTGAIQWALGAFYWLSSGERLAASYLWSGLATIGMLLFWLATRSLIGRKQHLYAAAVLLLPSLLFWNAGVGKEALVTLGIGATIYGYWSITGRAKVPAGIAYLAFGTIVIGAVRPHVGLVLLGSLGVGILLGSSRFAKGGRSRWVFGLLIIGLLAVLILPVTLRLLDAGAGESLLEASQRRAEVATSQGGRSDFETQAVGGIGDIPRAVTTVLFRPFLWEVRTVPQLAAAIESTVIACFLIVSVWQVIVGRLSFRRTPLVVGATTYVILFSAAIASYGNFGLLVRQRTQVIAFLIFVLFSLQPRALNQAGLSVGSIRVSSKIRARSRSAALR